MYVSANEKTVSLNLHRYNTEYLKQAAANAVKYGWKKEKQTAVGLCTLNQVDP
jgi:hypothetical protein